METKMADHYYSKAPSSKLTVSEIKVSFFNHTFNLYTGSGVFSIGRVDKGTEILINNARLENGWNVLDLGCGYGVVGISIAHGFPKSSIVMTDVNKRAIGLARKNIKLNKLDKRDNIQITDGDRFSALDKEKEEHQFNTILLNPPHSAGKDLCLDMIKESFVFLKPKGTLQIVARKNKGGLSLSKQMEETFGNVEVIGKKSGYSVYLSQKE